MLDLADIAIGLQLEGAGIAADQSGKPAEVLLQLLKIETFKQQYALIAPLFQSQFFCGGDLCFCLGHESLDDRIGFHSRIDQRRAEYHAFEGPAAAEGHIYLSWGKCRLGIDNRLVKGQPLALVNGDSPSRFERILLESADNFLGNFSGFLINRVFDVFPGGLTHLDGSRFAGTLDLDHVFKNRGYLTDLAIKVSLVRPGVISCEHDLCPVFQLQAGCHRVGVLRKIPIQFGGKTAQPTLQFTELVAVDGIGTVVVRA